MNKVITLFLIISMSFTFAFFAMDDIHQAVEEGNFAKVQEILHANPDAVNARTEDDNTPLHAAAYFGHVNVAQLLIHNRANVDARDKQQQTSLHAAAFEGNIDVAQLLIHNRANVDARDKLQQTPLHCAAMHAPLIKVVQHAQLLLDNRATVDARDVDNCTPLHMAAYKGREALVRLLLEHRADVDARHKMGRTPYNIAGHTNIAQLLRDWPMYRACLRRQTLAFFQATHPRLGADSPVRNLPYELTRYIAQISIYHNNHTRDEIHQMAEQERVWEQQEQDKKQNQEKEEIAH